MKILIGIDDSDGGRDAVALAKLLHGTGDDKILLVNVLALDHLFADPYRLIPADKAAGSEDVFQAPRRALAGAEVETRSVTADSPARAIQALAEEEEADLIVIGSPHRGALGRALIGSVGESLLHGSPCPLVVAPRGYAAGAPSELAAIAVAYDGSPEAKLALQRAEALSRASAARLLVLTAVAPALPMPVGVGSAPMVGFDAEALIEEALASIGPGLDCEGRRLDGPPAAVLAEACEDGIDLLVTGSRGYGPLGRVFAGSVCSKLIREAPCPVLVVPRRGP